jgi:hypothetical protein
MVMKFDADCPDTKQNCSFAAFLALMRICLALALNVIVASVFANSGALTTKGTLSPPPPETIEMGIGSEVWLRTVTPSLPRPVGSAVLLIGVDRSIARLEYAGLSLKDMLVFHHQNAVRSMC